MIYFDNASTGGFKIRAVIDSAQTVCKYLCANPTRSGHRLALTGAKIVYNCRESLSNFFGSTIERTIFTKNCTEALNLAIFGSLKKGGHVITTVYEHNSVLRPLFALKNKGLIELDVVCPQQDFSLCQEIERKIKSNTYLIVATAVSNVTGFSLPINQIGQIAKKHNLLFLVDGAQGGGHIPLNLKNDNIHLLALAGHKGLYGIMGSGALLFDESIELEPLMYGGTGTESLNLNQPDCYPERLEAGTLNLPAISALNEGVRYISQHVNNFGKNLFSFSQNLIDNLKTIKSVKCFSQPNPSGICAFLIEGKDSSDVADILNSKFDIAVRAGLHCAPLMHKHLQTEKCGLIRASLAVQNNTHEINYFLNAISQIAKS